MTLFLIIVGIIIIFNIPYNIYIQNNSQEREKDHPLSFVPSHSQYNNIMHL